MLTALTGFAPALLGGAVPVSGALVGVEDVAAAEPAAELAGATEVVCEVLAALLLPGPRGWLSAITARTATIRPTSTQIAAVTETGRCGVIRVNSISELFHLVDAHPLREHLREHLIRALWRVGRRADALAVFRTVDAGHTIGMQFANFLGHDHTAPATEHLNVLAPA